MKGKKQGQTNVLARTTNPAQVCDVNFLFFSCFWLVCAVSRDGQYDGGRYRETERHEEMEARRGGGRERVRERERERDKRKRKRGRWV